MHRLIGTDRAAIAYHQLIAVAYHVDDIAIEQDPAGFTERHWSSWR
jgi:hypothetical protein